MVFVDDCIFCQIAQKKIPANIVYEDEKFIVFLDIHPANKGHALVVPKNHFVDLLSLSEEDAKELFAVVHRVAQGIKIATHADALNVVQNNGAAAGQVIPHIHVHVIPRFEEDGMSFGTFRQGKYEGNEISTVREAIKSKIPEKKIQEKAEPEPAKQVKEETPKRSTQHTRHIRKEIEVA